MEQPAIPALRAPPPARDNPLTRSVAGILGLVFLCCMLVACLATLPYTLGRTRAPADGAAGSPRYDNQVRTARHLPPFWLGEWGMPSDEDAAREVRERERETARLFAMQRMARERGAEVTVERLETGGIEPTEAQVAAATPRYWMGTDLLGRSLLIRTLAGGGLSLTIGIAAAMLSVVLGTLYGAIAGYIGGRVDAVLMRIVDVLYGLPYILLVVLLAVASESVIDEYVSRTRARSAWVEARLTELGAGVSVGVGGATGPRESAPDPASEELQSLVQRVRGSEVAGAAAREVIARHKTVESLLESLGQEAVPARRLTATQRSLLDLTVLFVAIGGVSWLTMARVVRGQVLSLKSQPFMEAARAMGVGVRAQFLRHLLPNLVGPITVYATLTVPQAILQESFLSFLGIGVRPPLPSWGNLAAEGLTELNPYESRWWLLLFPCLLLGSTLLALNFVGEGLREAVDPKRRR